jgi:hypothetical protein
MVIFDGCNIKYCDSINSDKPEIPQEFNVITNNIPKDYYDKISNFI